MSSGLEYAEDIWDHGSWTRGLLRTGPHRPCSCSSSPPGRSPGVCQPGWSRQPGHTSLSTEGRRGRERGRRGGEGGRGREEERGRERRRADERWSDLGVARDTVVSAPLDVRGHLRDVDLSPSLPHQVVAPALRRVFVTEQLLAQLVGDMQVSFLREV